MKKGTPKFLTEEELMREIDRIMGRELSEEEEIELRIDFYKKDIESARDNIKFLKKQLKELRRG